MSQACRALPLQWLGRLKTRPCPSHPRSSAPTQHHKHPLGMAQKPKTWLKVWGPKPSGKRNPVLAAVPKLKTD